MFDLFHNGDTADWFESWASIAGHDPSSNTSDLSSEGFANLFPRPYDPDLEANSTGWTPEADLVASGKAEPTYGPMSTYSNDEPTEVEEVVITSRPGMPIDEINQILDDLYGGNGFDPNVPPTGGGNDQPVEDRPHDPCEDRQADTLADQIKDEITAKGDSNRVEYHSVIWRDDQGNLHMTDPLPLTDTFPADPGALGLDSYSQVVGLVHSHPSEVNIGTESAPTWVDASHGWIWGGDWRDAQWWVDNHNLDENNFSMYIVYDGQVREYDWNDNKDRNVFNDVTDEDAVESGDYNPGASCS